MTLIHAAFKKHPSFKLRFLGFCFLINSLLFTSVSASLTDCLSLNPSVETCIEQIKLYLQTHSLEPIIQKGEVDFRPVHFEKDSYHTTYVYGDFTQGSNTYHSMSYVKKELLQSTFETKILCLSTEPVPSPLFFHDVTHYIDPKYLPGELKDLCVYIEKSDAKPLFKGAIMHRWVFFNPFNSKAFDVMIQPDGQGGTYFQVTLVDATEEKQKQFTLDCMPRAPR